MHSPDISCMRDFKAEISLRASQALADLLQKAHMRGLMRKLLKVSQVVDESHMALLKLDEDTHHMRAASLGGLDFFHGHRRTSKPLCSSASARVSG